MLCKTYRAGRQETHLPLSHLMSLLLFEDEDDAVNFLTACNLDVSDVMLCFVGFGCYSMCCCCCDWMFGIEMKDCYFNAIVF